MLQIFHTNKSDLKICLIGSGNVASVLGRALLSAGNTITCVMSRNIEHGRKLAVELNAEATDNGKKIPTGSELYLVAVSDAAIPEVSGSLSLDEKLIAHTSGAVSINVLKNASANFGVLYPLQSLRKEMEEIPEIPFLIGGNSEETKSRLYSLAKTISSKVVEATDEERLRLHVAAVIVSNFTNFLYALSKDYVLSNRLDFNLLTPLIKEVAQRTSFFDPAQMQTGPAMRGDAVTIQKHLQLLEDHPQLQQVYEFLTMELRKFYHK